MFGVSSGGLWPAWMRSSRVLRVLCLVGVAGGFACAAPSVFANDTFTVTLPLSASNGVPGSGAGNLENTTTQDIYQFTTSATHDLAVSFTKLSAV